jgi:hypothetical protein
MSGDRSLDEMRGQDIVTSQYFIAAHTEHFGPARGCFEQGRIDPFPHGRQLDRENPVRLFPRFRLRRNAAPPRSLHAAARPLDKRELPHAPHPPHTQF